MTITTSDSKLQMMPLPILRRFRAICQECGSRRNLGETLGALHVPNFENRPVPSYGGTLHTTVDDDKKKRK